MRQFAIQLVRFVSRLAALLASIVVLYCGAVGVIGTWYALTAGEPGVIRGGALVQAAFGAASVAAMLAGARLLVYATDARAPARNARRGAPADDGTA